MKKIGILTYHKSINYGSVLQCWALEEKLLRDGYDVEVIDYEPKEYSKYYVYHSPKGIKQCLNIGTLKRYIINQQNNFTLFRSDYLNLSKSKYFYNSSFEALTKYDAIICGSDQIWNIRAADCDPIFFLPFKTEGRKIAYAVSTNSTTFKEKRANELLKKQILDFDFISEREESGAIKLSTFIDNKKKVDICADPTLFHKAEEYSKICSNKILKEPYIFLYNVWTDKNAVAAAIYLSKRLKLPVYCGFMHRNLKTIYKLQKKGIHTVLNRTSPKDFLSLIKYADWIVTDSFHGTAFSIIFEKEFLSINERLSNGLLKNDKRIIDILDRLGLSDRYIALDDFDKFDCSKHIDYEAITESRMQFAQISNNKLCDAIEGKLNS